MLATEQIQEIKQLKTHGAVARSLIQYAPGTFNFLIYQNSWRYVYQNFELDKRVSDTEILVLIYDYLNGTELDNAGFCKGVFKSLKALLGSVKFIHQITSDGKPFPSHPSDRKPVSLPPATPRGYEYKIAPGVF